MISSPPADGLLDHKAERSRAASPVAQSFAGQALPQADTGEPGRKALENSDFSHTETRPKTTGEIAETKN
ncbi:hypothetical protein [Lysobacter sp. 1R34A]|uniref:hypothetical protein n=1 Tax=Lysobacter sp. 1R34A TaxID=3445786 RepID=UPI003EEF82E6